MIRQKKKIRKNNKFICDVEYQKSDTKIRSRQLLNHCIIIIR